MSQKASYSQRIESVRNPAAKKLLQLMEEKQSNLVFANDETDPEKFLEITDKIGPEIAVFKTHIDVIENFTPAIIDQLRSLKKEHQFMIFEDRKFADIGNTVILQYEKGIYHIVEWADFVNAHVVPGPGIIEGLREVGMKQKEPRGLILLVQMTPEGNLATDEYMQKGVEMAKQYDDFVVGFIGNGGDVTELKKLSALSDPRFIIFTPGVKIGGGGDTLKQRYTTPAEVIAAGSDLLIVARGISSADDPLAAAKEYRRIGWEAYREAVA